MKSIESASWRNSKTKLEDMMNMSSETTLQILVFKYDDFGCARKYFESKSYTFLVKRLCPMKVAYGKSELFLQIFKTS